MLSRQKSSEPYKCVKINVRYKSNAGTEPYELKNSIQNNKGTHTCHAITNRDFQQNLLELEKKNSENMAAINAKNLSQLSQICH